MAAQIVRHQAGAVRHPSRLPHAFVWGSLLLLVGCGGHDARTRLLRTALDAGQPDRAIAALNKELDVPNADTLPGKLEGDNALLVLDRASVQQARAAFAQSRRDFEAADHAIDILDLSQNASDAIVTYVYSDAGGRYKAPPYEKLLLNTMNMVNYLELGDLNGARVEARRLAVSRRFLLERGEDPKNPMFGLGSFLAGLTFEKSAESNEALRFYDESVAAGTSAALAEAVARLLPLGTYRTPALEGAAKQAVGPALDATKEGEIIVLVGYGRVPHKIAKRLPIGLALTYFSGALQPHDVAAANRLAAQGLVTWINYPSLAPARGDYETPILSVDGRSIPLANATDIGAQVDEAWKKIEGRIIVSAITRLVSRYVVGEGIRQVGGGGLIATLASLGTQATLTALDTPDTRSWEALPARVALARLRVPAGHHTVNVGARGSTTQRELTVPAGGWSLVSLLALR